MKTGIGSQLGNYTLLSSLGTGGFAVVYLGEHIYLQTKAAIKVLHVGSDITHEDLQQFLTEARTIAQLRHPHIISVLDFGVEDGRTPYLVMEYAPHGSLRSKHPLGSVLPLATVVSYTQQVASALQYGHQRRVVHCDVKPENMLLSQDERILLSDFGIAQIMQNTAHTVEPRAVAGTASYMAPEQFAGKSIPATDQYTLGVVVYQWLCGQLPFEGKTIAQMYYMHSHSQPSPLRKLVPEIPFAVEQVVLKALAKEADQRFPSVQAFADALGEAAEATIPRGIPARSFSPSALGSNDAQRSQEAFPLLPSAANSLPVGPGSLGEPSFFQGFEESLDFSQQEFANEYLTEACEEPADESPHREALPSNDDSPFIPLLPFSSQLLPSLDMVQEEAAQEPDASLSPLNPPAEEAHEWSLLPSIAFSLPGKKTAEEDISTVLLPSLPPREPGPSEPIALLPSASTIFFIQSPSRTQGDEVPHPGAEVNPPLPTNPLPQKIEIFLSYSHLDIKYRERLGLYLKHLEIIHPATTWYDGIIQPGTDFEKEIERHLREAHIILLLVSQSFIASDYCREKELKTAMERHEAGKARVIPIILQPALWKGIYTPFGKLLALPKNGKAITEWNNRARAYLEVAQGIDQVIIEMLKRVK